MREFGSFEAKNRLSELLDAVENGEEITITRRGKPVARLVRHDPGDDRAKAVDAAHRFMKRREKITLGGVATIRELIDEGRR